MDFQNKLQKEITASIYFADAKVQLLGNRVFIKKHALSHLATLELLNICWLVNTILTISPDKHSNNLIITFTDAS